jgi:hypothetical protein
MPSTSLKRVEFAGMRLEHKLAWRGINECAQRAQRRRTHVSFHCSNDRARHPRGAVSFPQPPSDHGLDVGDRFANGRDLLGIGVGDFDVEFLPERKL